MNLKVTLALVLLIAMINFHMSDSLFWGRRRRRRRHYYYRRRWDNGKSIPEERNDEIMDEKEGEEKAKEGKGDIEALSPDELRNFEIDKENPFEDEEEDERDLF